jgi:hypothetical protein
MANISDVVASCEFYSPINLEGSFGSVPVSDRMHSTMEFYSRNDNTGGMIEWCVWDADGDAEFVEGIGIWWDAETKELRDYDGVFEIPREALELLVSMGVKMDNYEEEMNYPLNETFKLTTNNK